MALPERTTPELLYLEGKFAGLISYDQSASLLAQTLPLGRPLHAIVVRLHAQATTERLEQELGAKLTVIFNADAERSAAFAQQTRSRGSWTEQPVAACGR